MSYDQRTMPPSDDPNSDKLSQQDRPVESNIKSIRAIEQQIREHDSEAAIIQLKRARNSLLNVSKLPPEILGEIFRLNCTLERDFGPLEERSHNFLLVCHHWFEVASRTPEVWSFWGSDLEDWTRRHRLHPTAPLDLVFDGDPDDGLGDSLLNALQDRAARDTIRRVHLSTSSGFLGSILSLLASCDGIRTSSVESVFLWAGEDPLDVSDFLACYRFPKLRRLELRNLTISSWDPITSNISVLTALTLDNSFAPPTITLPQILSILRSNPSLQEVTLAGSSIPDDDDGTSFRVSLAHLRKLDLDGRPRGVFTLLHQLDYPRSMDNLIVRLSDITAGDIPKIIGPSVRDYVQRRRSPGSGLGLELDLCYYGNLSVVVGDPGRADFPPSAAREWMDKHLTIKIFPLGQGAPVRGVIFDLIAYLPREEITHVRIHDELIFAAALSAQLPYLRAIHYMDTCSHYVFRDLDQEEMFPHLQHLRITASWQFRTDGSNWGPFTAFLDHLESFGHRLDKLELDGRYHIDPSVEEKIRGMVGELTMTMTPADERSSVSVFDKSVILVFQTSHQL
ncbi:hypothetical protein BJ322DRAFT_494618 [Thelephora terrestris]|uniref:F-box domain-containing protein n=1 Tax=Thelephora terrestris TaxID=56493 RepID=A0A9P6L1P9_9AGAM|nr:hypothetical protein BJ322DRAFT_494618 [Thelephora terrestris]